MATLTWVGTTTAWGLASNWSPAQVPTSADDVIFNNAANCIALSSGTACNSLDFNGYTGSFTSVGTGGVTISGSNTGTTTGISLRLSSGMTISGFTTTFAFVGVGGYIYCNGKTFASLITFNNATGVWSTQDVLTSSNAITITAGTLNINYNLTIGTASAFTFTAGTINANNGVNITCGTFNSSAANVRTFNMGSSNWTLTSTGIVWVVNATSMTLNCGQSKIIVTNTSATATTFSSTGSLTYYTIEYARGGGAGNLIFATTTITTITNFIDNTSTAAHNIQFASGQWNFYKFNVRGTAGALVTISRSGTTSPTIAKVGQGIVPYCDYLNIVSTGLTSSPTNTWYAGANSTGSGGGWVMTAAPSSQSLLGGGGVG